MEASDARGSRNVLDLRVDQRSNVLESTTGVRRESDLPLAGSNVFGVEVSLLETREPPFHGSCGVAVSSTENDVHAKMAVASAAFVALVIRGLQPAVRHARPLLTPSSKKTVDCLQSGLCFVRALAKYVMKSIKTSLSVLQVVRATHTSPSVDMAVMMLTFCVRVFSGAVLSIPRLFHRL